MLRLVEQWAADLKPLQPDLRISADRKAKLAADGFQELLDGRANCVTFVREPFESELKAFRARFGHEPTLVPVAGGSFATRGGTHAVAIYVNEKNPLAHLSLAQLDRVFSDHPRHGGAPIRRWGQLGLTGAWRDRPIHAFGMLKARATGNPPGLVNFLQQRMLLGGRFRADLIEQVDRPGEQSLEAIVRQVAADPDAIGFSGFGYIKPGVRAVPLGETPGGAWVAGSPASVATRRYPLSRRIYILIDREPGRPVAPATAAFLRYVLSREGQAAIAADPEGFLPLSAADTEASLRMLR